LSPRSVRLGLLGLGTVGGGLVELVARNARLIEGRSGVRLEIVRALVRDLAKPRPIGRDRLTQDAAQIVEASDVDLVVEVMGGLEPAREYTLRALRAGKPVVTANKALLAAHGDEVFSEAARADVGVGFEASVGGGIPIVRALAGGLVANEVEELIGILNGTSNFVLTRMYKDRLGFAEAVALAQAGGLAEADPSYDVDGLDAAHKLAILTELAFQTKAPVGQIEREGIGQVEPVDIRVADEFGYVIKPVAVARRQGESLDLRVHPALVPFEHPLGPVSDEFNALMVRGDAIGQMVFHGKGAGSLPTASAVLSDIVEIARNPSASVMWDPGRSKRLERIEGRSGYYLRFPILDRPGVIGRIATTLGDHGISITRAQANLLPEQGEAGNVMVLTHPAAESEVCAALAEIAATGTLRGEPLSLRILD
jgi:homoserine dehydrogenase